MSYEKQPSILGYNINHPFGKPLYGQKKVNQKFSVIFDDDMQNLFNDDERHPLFKVSSGLPGSLGDALGDLDPDFASSAILSFIYGLRTLKTVKETAQNLFGKLKTKVKAYNEKFTKGYDDVPIMEDETFIPEGGLAKFADPAAVATILGAGVDKWQLDAVKDKNEKLKKEVLPLRLLLNELTRFYLSTVEDKIALDCVRLGDDDAAFLNKLSSLRLDAELIKGVKCLPRENFKKFRTLVDFRFDESREWSSLTRGYVMIEKPVLCTEPKKVVEKPWTPSNDWPQKALVEEHWKDYESLGDIYNNQKLGSFEAEPGFPPETNDKD